MYSGILSGIYSGIFSDVGTAGPQPRASDLSGVDLALAVEVRQTSGGGEEERERRGEESWQVGKNAKSMVQTGTSA